MSEQAAARSKPDQPPPGDGDALRRGLSLLAERERAALQSAAAAAIEEELPRLDELSAALSAAVRRAAGRGTGPAARRRGGSAAQQTVRAVATDIQLELQERLQLAIEQLYPLAEAIDWLAPGDTGGAGLVDRITDLHRRLGRALRAAPPEQGSKPNGGAVPGGAGTAYRVGLVAGLLAAPQLADAAGADAAGAVAERVEAAWEERRAAAGRDLASYVRQSFAALEQVLDEALPRALPAARPAAGGRAER